MNCQHGVYKIINKVNGKFYIGSTTTPFPLRFGQHKSQLRGNYHFNPHLQYSWNKYGESNFEFLPVEVCGSAEDCLQREQYYIKTLHPPYNVITDTKRKRIYKHNQTAKDRISLAFKGRNHPQYSGEYVFYHPKHGYFTGSLIEFAEKHGYPRAVGHKLKNGILYVSHDWIFVSSSKDPLPINIEELYEQKLNQNKPTYTFYNPNFGEFCGTIPRFMKNHNIKTKNNSTIRAVTSGKRKMAWGWICLGEGKVILTDEQLQTMYEVACKHNKLLHRIDNNVYTFCHPTLGTHTLKVKDFTKKFQLHPQSVKRLCHKGRQSYRKWRIS